MKPGILMKHRVSGAQIGGALCAVLSLPMGAPAQAALVFLGIGPQHRVGQETRYQTNELGGVSPHPSQDAEIATRKVIVP